MGRDGRGCRDHGAHRAGIVFGWLPEAWGSRSRSCPSIASLAGVLSFPVAFPTFSTVGAVAVDMAVLVAVLWYHWVPSDILA